MGNSQLERWVFCTVVLGFMVFFMLFHVPFLGPFFPGEADVSFS